MRSLAVIVSLSVFASAWLLTGNTQADETPATDMTEPRVFITQHSGRFGNKTINYTATAGETHVRNADGEALASIFSVAYTMNGVDDPGTRPVVFLFNGGPGSASLWLHMGAFGPEKLVLPSDAKDDGAPPYEVTANTETILDIADIVFIDPVGTGYSYPLGEHEGSEFWGITEDARSVATFMRQWVTENGRWNSPKYLGGESYGTLRTSAVVNELEGGINDMSLNGVLLISAFQSYWDDAISVGNEIPYVTTLPTMAATAVYHQQVEHPGQSFEAFLDEVRAFAIETYLPALFQGDRIEAARKQDIISKLARYTGLSETFIQQANMRISDRRFYKELLRDQGLTVGRLDSRFTGNDFDNAGEAPDWDPSFYGIDGAFTAVMNDYMKRKLNVDIDRLYEPLSFQVNQSWDADIEGSDFNYGVGQYLGKASRENNDFRVWVSAGYYDFATPFFGIENALSRVGMMPGRVTYTYYQAGHMMYIHHPSLSQFLEDARAFILAGQ